MTIEMMKAEAIAVDSMQEHILCPICREIHRHGSSGDINLDNCGTRVQHCARSGRSPDCEYVIITTPATIRKDVGLITARDLKPWKNYTKSNKKLPENDPA